VRQVIAVGITSVNAARISYAVRDAKSEVLVADVSDKRDRYQGFHGTHRGGRKYGDAARVENYSLTTPRGVYTIEGVSEKYDFLIVP